MDRSVIISQVFHGTLIHTEAISRLEQDLHAQLTVQGTLSSQQTRYSLRILRRWSQLNYGIIAVDDFLAALRDCVLYIGRIKSPPKVLEMVVRQGNYYGLFVDADYYVNAKLDIPVWLTQAERQFVETVYGKGEFVHEPRPLSLGDGLLAQTTAFTHYRAYEQKIAVHSALTLPPGFTMLLSLPTGGGKSLVTQMLTGVQQVLTLVIVPTVALALDQERAAREVLYNSVPEEAIACYHQDQREHVVSRILLLIKQGQMRLLITSPEAVLKNNALREALEAAAVNQTLGAMVFDEAHMIPDWGATFRPEFQLLAVFRRKLLALSKGTVKTYLLSATLADDNVQTLKDLYSDEDRWLELRSDALRQEPRYWFAPCDSNDMRRERVLELCRKMPKPLILYVLTPTDAEIWVKYLKGHGWQNVRSFSGETSDLERQYLIDAWRDDQLDMVVATSAFGLGVDKPDVKTVIHACLPESLSRFYQEVGRGGRDGWPYLSILCLNPTGDPTLTSDEINGDNRAASSLVPRVMRVEYMVPRWLSMRDAETSHHAGDVIELDTSVAPSYFSDQQRVWHGEHNMGWNLHVLLFLLRYGYLDLLEVEFNGARRSYYLKVRLNDIDLMSNPTALTERLTIDRERELTVVRKGFNHMLELVHKPGEICWGSRFVELFPYAYQSCSGCPQHSTQILAKACFYLGKSVPFRNQVADVVPALEEYMGSFTDMLVPRRETGSFDQGEMQQLALKLSCRGLGVWVVPDVCSVQTRDFKGLVFTAKEFLYTCQYHPSLLAQGIFLTFTEDNNVNQSLFEQSEVLRNLGVRVVYYARPSMYVNKYARALVDLVEGYVRSAKFVLEGLNNVS